MNRSSRTPTKLAFMLAFCATALISFPEISRAENTQFNDSSFQFSNSAVDGLNASLDVRTGVLDGVSNSMFVGSLSSPVLFVDSFGAQIDIAAGLYDGNITSTSYAAAGHLFWRNPQSGMFGLYLDFGKLEPVHIGRLGFEGALYGEKWTIEALAVIEFGQNVETRYVDEIDFSYYFTNNLKASIGHRLTSRGNLLNAGFEKQFASYGGGAWSIFAEGEVGQDNFNRVSAGIRFAFGTGQATTLMERDRSSGVRVRIPRNLASITQCGKVDVPFRDPQWLYDIGLTSRLNNTTCGAKGYINGLSSTGIFNP